MIAAEVMTENPRTVLASDVIGDALEVLQMQEIRHLPVVDDDGNLVGMLSDRDLGPLMRTFIEGEEAQRRILPLSRRRVVDFMSSDVVSVDLDTEVSAIVEAMLEQRIGAVPVVDGEGAVTGIISYVDLLRVLGGPEESARPIARAKRPPAGTGH
jgi:acetoin utilization protein AcuB